MQEFFQETVRDPKVNPVWIHLGRGASGDQARVALEHAAAALVTAREALDVVRAQAVHAVRCEDPGRSAGDVAAVLGVSEDSVAFTESTVVGLPVSDRATGLAVRDAWLVGAVQGDRAH